MSVPTPQESCDKILMSLRDSNLHFLIQESPYSAYLTIRKRFSKNPVQKTSKDKNENLSENEIHNLTQEIYTKGQKIDALNQEIVTLKAENETLNQQAVKNTKEMKNMNKVRNEKENELQILKQSSKRQNSEIVKFKEDLRLSNKTIKAKEKELFALDMKNDNLAENLQRAKSESRTLIAEKKKLEKGEKQRLKKTNSSKNESPVQIINNSQSFCSSSKATNSIAHCPQ